MKRKIAVVLCLAMMTLSLIGCSQAELAYLEMARQLSSESYKASGTVTAEIDFDALSALAEKTSAKLAELNPYSYLYDSEFESELAFAGLEGTKKIELHYEMLADMKEGMAFQADFDVELDGKAYPLGDLYYDAIEGLYVSKDLLLGFYDFYKDAVPALWDSYFYSQEYRTELLKAFGEREYVYIGYYGDWLLDEMEFETMMDFSFDEYIYDEAYKFLTTAFSGFSTGTVSSISGGYSISLDGKQAKKLAVDVLQYAIDNLEKIVKAYMEYSFKIMEASGFLDEDEIAESKEYFEEMLGPRMQIMTASSLAGARQAIISADRAGYLDFLNGLKYHSTLRKQGNTYRQQEEISLKDGRTAVFSLTSESTLTIQAVEIDLPVSIIFAEDVEEAVTALENKYNPVSSAVISWWTPGWDGSLDEAFIEYEREKESPFSSQLDIRIEPYLIKEGRIYVPLRNISEAFGEKVEWDANARKAYVVRDGAQIDMTGILEGGQTFIKVRDFEKLGYKVGYEYDAEWEMHIATISR